MAEVTGAWTTFPAGREMALYIAAVAHEANRALCMTFGDFSQPSWDRAPEWQRLSAEDGVRAILDGIVTTPEDSHVNWLAEKTRTGWKYGPVKDPDKKEHPCMVDFRELPVEQRAKDHLFFAVVTSLLQAAEIPLRRADPP